MDAYILQWCQRTFAFYRKDPARSLSSPISKDSIFGLQHFFFENIVKHSIRVKPLGYRVFYEKEL